MGIGIIGLGVVGGTMYRAFKAVHHDVLGYDINPAHSHDALDETLSQNVVLISLPTPVDAEGRCDLSAIHSILDHAATLKVDGSLVLRSTVPVGTTDALICKYPRLKLGISPEFLRHRTAEFDFLNPPMTIYGGGDPKPYWETINLVCKGRDLPRIVLSPSEAEMVKLFLNGFAAIKAVFVSELAQFARSSTVDWNKVVAAAKLDERLGEGYLDATGPDHLPGIGGSCLPKDCRMLARQLGENCVLETILKVNERLRIQARDSAG